MILTSGGNPIDSHNYVWDVMTLSWVQETQPGGGGGGGVVDQGLGGLSPWLVNINGTPTVIVDPDASTAALTSVAASASSVTLISVNSARRELILFNDSTSILYVKFGTTASSSDFTYKLASQDTLEFPQPVYTGRVDGIWVSANGSALLTEVTA